jgi:HEAT repeat protein
MWAKAIRRGSAYFESAAGEADRVLQLVTIMSDKGTELRGSWWAKNLDDVDREIARLATICNVRILDDGVIERVLNNDASVCAAANPIAFGKLRDALMMHYHIRQKAVSALGETGTRSVIADIVENLRRKIGDRLGTPPPT